MKSFPALKRGERIKKIKSQKNGNLVLVLEDIADEKNIALILRTAECLGIERVCLVHTLKKHRILKRESSGAYKWLNLEFFNSTKDCLNQLKEQGFKAISSVVDPSAEDLESVQIKGKVALVVGNESKGVSEETLSLSDQRIYIKMVGMTESLNVSVATGILLYEIISKIR